MTLVARHAARSDIGLHRKSNEDAYVVAPPLFAVCDGMGGALGGEVASRLAADTLAAAVAAGESVPAAAAAANTAVYERAVQDSSLAGMGTTLTAVLLDGDTGRFAHVGDSRAYLLRAGGLRQLSDDHSLVGEMMREGRLTAEEAAVHPHRSILSRALGTEPQVSIDEFSIDLQPGDALLLCSDGLSGTVPPQAMLDALSLDDPDAAVETLIAAAREGGGPDNITAVVLRLDDAPAATDDADEASEAGAGEATVALAVADDVDTGFADDVGADIADAPHGQEASDQTARPDTGPDDHEGSEPDGATAQKASVPSPEDAVAEHEAAVAEHEAAGAEHEAAAAEDTEAGTRRSRRRLGCVVVVLLLVVALAVGAAIVLTTVYYVGVDDGTLTVYSGLPVSVGPLHLHAVYRRSTKPYAALDAAARRVVDAHALRSRDGALALAQDLGMWP